MFTHPMISLTVTLWLLLQSPTHGPGVGGTPMVRVEVGEPTVAVGIGTVGVDPIDVAVGVGLDPVAVPAKQRPRWEET